MSTHTPHTHRRPAAILVVPIVVALVVTLFAWPSARLEPRDLPVGVAGPPAAAQQLERRLSAHEGAFDVEHYDDEAAARQAIEDREVYGAFVATHGGGKVLTASAASPMVAQQLTQAASQGDAPVQVEDVVPVTREGLALSSAVLPLVIAGIITGAAAAALASTALRRAALVVAGSALAGVGATTIIQSWLGVVGGDWTANAAAVSLTVMAIAAVVAGFEALLGKAGLALAAVTMVFVGNPFSGAANGHEVLPQPVGDLGQLLPPGAGASLLRSTGLFDGAAGGGHAAVLAAWALLGFSALAVSALRARRPAARRDPGRPAGGGRLRERDGGDLAGGALLRARRRRTAGRRARTARPGGRLSASRVRTPLPSATRIPVRRTAPRRRPRRRGPARSRTPGRDPLRPASRPRA